jgi:enoyl-CoA hydratase/carnithine racemase
MSDYETLRIDHVGAVMNVTISNPPINLQNDAMMADLNRLVGRLEADRSTKVVVFRSDTPGYFIAHFDIASGPDRDAAARARELAEELSKLSAFALATIKRCVYASVDTDFATGLKFEAHCFADTLLSDEALAQMRAYLSVPTAQRGALFGLRRPS